MFIVHSQELAAYGQTIQRLHHLRAQDPLLLEGVSERVGYNPER